MKQEGSRSYYYLLLRGHQKASFSLKIHTVGNWDSCLKTKVRWWVCGKQAEGTQPFNAWAPIPPLWRAPPIHVSLWSLEPREKRGVQTRETAVCGLCTLGFQAAWSFRRSLGMKVIRSSIYHPYQQSNSIVTQRECGVLCRSSSEFYAYFNV